MNQKPSRPRLAASLLALSLAVSTSAQAAPQTESNGEPAFHPKLATNGLVESVDGGFTAGGHSHRARFDDRGALLGVANPDDPNSEATLTLRLVDHGRAGHVRNVARRLPAGAGTDRLRYKHTGIVERYRVHDQGFEQSFVIPQRPAGHGDYILGIAATGEGLELPRTVAKHGAIEFVHGGQASIRYGEAVVFERGGMPVPIATRCDGVGRIELIVPGSFLDRASYPVIVDPSVGPVFLPGDSSFVDTAPDVAQHASTGNYLFVWQRQLNFFTEIRGRLYRRDGLALTPVIALTNSGQARNPAVCGVEGFLVAYEWGDHIRVRNFSATSGAALSGEVQVSNPPAGEQDRRPCISGDGNLTALVVYDRTASGATQPYQVRAETVYNTVTWLSSSGTVLESVTGGYVHRPRIPRNLVSETIGGEIWSKNRVVWERFYTSPSPGDADVRTAAIRGRYGSLVIDDGPETVAGAGSIGPNEYLADIGLQGFSTNDPDPLFLIAWDEENDIKAHRYSVTGSIGTEIDIRSTSDVETEPAVGAGACEFTVAYLQATPPNEFALNVRAARVLPDGSVPVSDRSVDVLNGPFQTGLRASSLQLSTTGSRRTNTVMLTWQGATGPSTGLNDVRARMYEPVAPIVAPYGSPCAGPGGTLPVIGTNWDPIPGNELFEVHVSNAPANSLAVLLIGNVLTTAPLPGAPGCSIYMGVPFLDAIPTVTSNIGFGYVSLPIPCSVPPGSLLAFQWGVYTPGHNSLGWITSDDLDVTWVH